MISAQFCRHFDRTDATRLSKKLCFVRNLKQSQMLHIYAIKNTYTRKALVQETPYASNSWAQAHWPLVRGLQAARCKQGVARRWGNRSLRYDSSPPLAPRHLSGPAQDLGPKAWAHGPRDHELEAYGVSSTRGFEATSRGNVVEATS